jgi:tetratricopeptide (TPR) repeat protein
MNQMKMFAQYGIVLLAVCLGQTAFAQSLQEGLKMMSYEKLPQAVTIFENLAKSTPTDADVLFQLGNAYLATNEITKAKDTYAKIILANPKSLLGNIGAAKIAMIEEKGAEAAKILEAAVKTSKGKDVNILRYIGEAYLVGKKPNADAAIAVLTKAVALGKKDAMTNLTLGDAYLAKNEGGKTLTNYEYAAEYNTKDPVAHFKIAEAYLRARNNVEALKAFEKSKAIDPNFPPVYRELGDFFYELNRYEEAEQNYAKYLQIGNPDIDDRTKHVNTLFLSKKYPETIATVNELIKIDNSKNYLNRLLAYSYYETKDSAKALEMMETFLKKTEPQKLIAMDYQYYGKILAKFQKLDDAANAYKKAIAIADTAKTVKEEQKLELIGELAYMYYDKDKYPEAVSYYRMKLARTATPSATDYYDLGKSCYYGKMYASADSAFAKLSELKPNLPTGHLWQAKTAKKIEGTTNNGKAIPYYEKFVSIATADPAITTKYKKDIFEAFSYLTEYAYSKGDKNTARTWAQKAVGLDPTNKYCSDILRNIGQ